MIFMGVTLVIMKTWLGFGDLSFQGHSRNKYRLNLTKLNQIQLLCKIYCVCVWRCVGGGGDKVLSENNTSSISGPQIRVRN